MPLAEELRSTLDSELADMTNVKIAMCRRHDCWRSVLGEVVDEDASWAHLTLQVQRTMTCSYSVYPSGATGVMVRTLVNLAGLI